MADETQQTQTGNQASAQSSSQAADQQTATGTEASANSQQSTTQNSATSSQTAAKAARPDWLPQSHWDGDKATIKPEFGQHFRDLTAFKAAEDSRRLTLPAKPEDYQLKLPADFKPPEGVEYKPADTDPRLPLLRQFAKDAGLTQAQFEGLIALDAAGQVSTQQQIKDAKVAELAKLGVNGDARMTAAKTWLNSIMGEDLGQHFATYMLTEKQVLGVEKAMAHFRNQGVNNFNHDKRDPPADAGKWTEEQFQNASPAARLDYTRQFSQAQFQQNNGAGR